MKKEKQELLDMIRNVENIMQNAKIEYTLSYGSLIGAVRENGFIPWDNEIDIWVHQSVYDNS